MAILIEQLAERQRQRDRRTDRQKHRGINSIFSALSNCTSLLSPPSTSMAVKPACWLKRGIQAFETMCLRKLLRISSLQHKTNDWVLSNINFLVGPQEPLLATVRTRKLAWFGHVIRTPRQPLQNRPSGHLGEWVTPWLAEEMVRGQRQRVDIPAHARIAHKGLLQNRLEKDLC